MKPSVASISDFRKVVLGFYKKNGRKMPWRETENAYHILVSEIMLQQTQVVRVMDKYGQFIAAFPDFKALDKAPLASVYAVWRGLGYNRRALALKKIASVIVNEYDGALPSNHQELCGLPGIGKATASSIMAFAFNLPVVFIETNIRTVFIHFFFKNNNLVSDDEIFPVVEKSLYTKNPRVWYWALMDYGAMLKKTGMDGNKQSSHYKKQSRFVGSRRQKRGVVLNLLSGSKGLSINEMVKMMRNEGGKGEKGKGLSVKNDELREIVRELISEGFVMEDKGRFFL
jgi:A/G-specific adenine glycosylase